MLQYFPAANFSRERHIVVRRIANGLSAPVEISGLHRLRRDQSLKDDSGYSSSALIVSEKEGAVSYDAATGAGAELVIAKARRTRRRAEELACLECPVRIKS